MTEQDRSYSYGARAEIVNRTHRIVRQRAIAMQAQRSFSKGLWAPLALCSVLLLALCYDVCCMLSNVEISDPIIEPSLMNMAPGSIMSLVWMWFLPVSFVACGAIWFLHARNESGRKR